jgi:hypothetical protein
MNCLSKVALVIGLVLVLWSPLCVAQTDQDRTAARAAAKAGHEAFAEGDFEKSIRLFEKAESLVHASTHLLYIARAHDKVGRLVLALENYNKLIYEQLPENAPTAFFEAQASAKEEVESLEPRIPMVTLVLQGKPVQDFELYVDGQARPGLTEVPQPIDPGKHTLKAVTKTASSEAVEVTLAEGDQETVQLTIVEVPEKGTPGPADTAQGPPVSAVGASKPDTTGDKPPKSKGSSAWRTVGWVSLGIGSVALLAGASTMIASAGNRGKANNLCEDETCEDDEEDQFQRLDKLADTFRIPGYLGLGVGVVGVAGGITLLVLTGKKRRGESSALQSVHVGSVEVTPHISARGMTVTGRF